MKSDMTTMEMESWIFQKLYTRWIYATDKMEKEAMLVKMASMAKTELL